MLQLRLWMIGHGRTTRYGIPDAPKAQLQVLQLRLWSIGHDDALLHVDQNGRWGGSAAYRNHITIKMHRTHRPRVFRF